MKEMNTLWTWAKHALCLLALAATAGLMLPACDKEPDQQDETPIPVYRAPYEKELRFNNRNADSIEMPVVQHFARDTACKHIYLTVTYDNNFTSSTSDDIHTLMLPILQKRIAIDSNKISGRGDFWFRRGGATTADSLWLIQHGWTINQLSNHR